MSGRKVLDSYSLLAYLENQPGGEKVTGLIKQARDKEKPLLLSAVNWGEIFYVVCRAAGKPAAEKAAQTLDTLPIEVVPVSREMAKAAAEFKATKKLSYADCFVAALAKLEKADVVTGDKEFKAVEESVKVDWI